MVIVNEKRKRQINEFIDEDRVVMIDYYDLLTDENISDAQIIKGMKKLIKKDPDFYDPYIEVAMLVSDDKETSALIKEAFVRAISRIVDYKGRWPKRMGWDYLENRHLMRAIEQYAILCWEENNHDEALVVFQNLLHMNPNDNQGVRYNILAIKLGLTIDEWESQFEVKKNGEIIGLDGRKVFDWFSKNAPKFPEEFAWLLDIYKRWDDERSATKEF